MSKSSKKITGFNKFLQNKLSFEDYSCLSKHLKVSKKYITALLQEPGIGSTDELMKLTELIQKNNPDFKMESLLKNYKFGFKKPNRVRRIKYSS